MKRLLCLKILVIVFFLILTESYSQSFQFPLLNKSPNNYTSTYGPRDKSDSNELYDYDFHEGFDINADNGENIYAQYNSNVLIRYF